MERENKYNDINGNEPNFSESLEADGSNDEEIDTVQPTLPSVAPALPTNGPPALSPRRTSVNNISVSAVPQAVENPTSLIPATQFRSDVQTVLCYNYEKYKERSRCKAVTIHRLKTGKKYARGCRGYAAKNESYCDRIHKRMFIENPNLFCYDDQGNIKSGPNNIVRDKTGCIMEEAFYEENRTLISQLYSDIQYLQDDYNVDDADINRLKTLITDLARDSQRKAKLQQKRQLLQTIEARQHSGNSNNNAVTKVLNDLYAELQQVLLVDEDTAQFGTDEENV